MITPPSSPCKRTKVVKSPGAKVKEMARLLKYHQHLCDEYDMPRSRLQQRLGEGADNHQVDQEEEEQLGCVKDLRGEFERMGAEALLPPLSTHSAKVREASKEKIQEGGEGERKTSISTTQTLACRLQSKSMQKLSECEDVVDREEVEWGGESEDQCTRGLEESTVSTPTYTVQTPACRQQTKPMQRLSECAGREGAVKTPTNWEWWYQPYGWRPNYWASLVFYCSGCQC